MLFKKFKPLRRPSRHSGALKVLWKSVLLWLKLKVVIYVSCVLFISNHSLNSTLFCIVDFKSYHFAGFECWKQRMQQVQYLKLASSSSAFSSIHQHVVLFWRWLIGKSQNGATAPSCGLCWGKWQEMSNVCTGNEHFSMYDMLKILYCHTNRLLFIKDFMLELFH